MIHKEIEMTDIYEMIDVDEKIEQIEDVLIREGISMIDAGIFARDAFNELLIDRALGIQDIEDWVLEKIFNLENPKEENQIEEFDFGDFQNDGPIKIG